jgi:hypothetical protein
MMKTCSGTTTSANIGYYSNLTKALMKIRSNTTASVKWKQYIVNLYKCRACGCAIIDRYLVKGYDTMQCPECQRYLVVGFGMDEV